MFIEPGYIVIAHPRMKDPFFKQTVILVIESDEFGVVGVILNKTSSAPFASLMEANGIDWDGNEPLYIGGLSGERSLFMIHSPGWYSENTLDLSEDLWVTSDYVMTDLTGAGQGPENYKFISGVTTWGPMQLETEIGAGKWLVIDYIDPAVFWTVDSADLWKVAIDNYAAEMVEYIFPTGDNEDDDEDDDLDEED